MLLQQKTLEKEVEQLKKKIASLDADRAADDVREIKGVKVIAKRVEADNPGALRNSADQYKNKIKSGIVVLGSASNDKALLISMVTKDLTDKYHAGKIIKKAAAMVGGGGGGRADMAQAGGSEPEKLDSALKKVFEIIKDV